MTWDRTRSHGDLVHTANAAIALHQIDAGEHLRHQPRHQVLRVLGDPPCPLQRQVQQLLVFHRRHVDFAQNSLQSQIRPLSIRDDLRLEELQLRIAFCSMVVTWLRSSLCPLVQSEHVSVPPRYLRMTGADVDVLEAYTERKYCNQESIQFFHGILPHLRPIRTRGFLAGEWNASDGNYVVFLWDKLVSLSYPDKDDSQIPSRIRRMRHERHSLAMAMHDDDSRPRYHAWYQGILNMKSIRNINYDVTSYIYSLYKLSTFRLVHSQFSGAICKVLRLYCSLLFNFLIFNYFHKHRCRLQQRSIREREVPVVHLYFHEKISVPYKGN